MLASDVIAHARQQLSNTSASRWSDVDLLAYLLDALHALKSVRPDAFLDSDETYITMPQNIEFDDELDVGFTLREPLGYLVASYALGEDSGDQANVSIANDYRNKAYQRLTGG